MSLIANILTVAKSGVPRTHLMYQANLSYRMLSTYVNYLVEIGLIETVKSEGNYNHSVFKTTKKGQRYLETYSSLLELATGLNVFLPFSKSPPELLPGEE